MRHIREEIDRITRELILLYNQKALMGVITTLQSDLTALTVRVAALEALKLPRVLHSKRIDAATVGVGYETLDTYAMPAGMLATDYDSLIIDSLWSSESANTTQHRLQVGGVTPLDYGANFGGGGTHVHTVIQIWRVDATHGYSISRNDWGGGNVYQTQRVACDLTWANALTFTWDGKCAAAAGGSRLDAVNVLYVPAVP